MTAWRITSRIGAAVVAVSVVACVVLAAIRSVGLTAVTVTALNPADEPVDHNIPLIKRHEALPDYELVVLERDGAKHYLGTKPDESAAEAAAASIRLREKDAVLSDQIAEVNIHGDVVESNGYRFEFQTERSAALGVKSFFATPIGMAITGAFFVAVLLLLLAAFAV